MFRRWLGNEKEESRRIRRVLFMQAITRMYPGSFRVVLHAEADYIGVSSPDSLQADHEYKLQISYDPERNWITAEVAELQGEKRIYMDADKLLDNWYFHSLVWQIFDLKDGTPLTGKHELPFP